MKELTPGMLRVKEYPLVYEPLSLMADVGLPSEARQPLRCSRLSRRM